MKREHVTGLFDNSPFCYQSLDTEGRIADVSRFWLKTFGYNKKEIAGKKLSEFIRKSGREDFDRYFEELKASGTGRGKSFDLKTKSGDYIRVSLSGLASYSADGEFFRFHGTLETDYDAAKAEKRLYALADMYENLQRTGLSVQGVSDSVLRTAMELTGSAGGYAGSIDEDSGNLIIHSCSQNNDRDCMLELERSPGGRFHGLLGRSLTTKKTVLLNGGGKPVAASGLPSGHMEVNSLLSVPVVLDGDLAGQVTLINSPSGYTEQDQETVQEIARLYAAGLKTRKEHQTEALFRTVYDSIEDMAVIYRSDGRDFFVKSINAAGLNLLGRPLSELKNRNMSDVFPGFGETIVQKSVRDAWETGKTVKVPYFRYEGLEFRMKMETQAFRLNEKYVVCIHRDIAKHVEASEKSADTGAKYRTYIEHAPEPIIMLDKKFDIIDFNLAALKKFGYSAEELRDMNITKLWPKEHAERNLRSLTERRNTDSFNTMHPHISKTGERFQIQVHVSRMPDGTMMGTLQDMTDWVEVERELSAQNAELLEKVNSEDSKRKKQEQLLFDQKKLADMGQMVNTIAHQWRQPINALGLYVQHVYETYAAGSLSRKDMEEFREDSMGLVHYMSRTIDDFMGFFRSDSYVVDFNAASEVRSLLKLLNPHLNMKGIIMQMSCISPEGKVEYMDVEAMDNCERYPVKVCGYPGEFKQALINIIYNAADAVTENMAKTPGSGRGMIDVRIIYGESYVKVSVSDNGTGIPDEVLPQIFEPYFTTKGKDKGTGIGLYMSKLVVEHHMKGTILAENTSNGANVEITLPINAFCRIAS